MPKIFQYINNLKLPEEYNEDDVLQTNVSGNIIWGPLDVPESIESTTLQIQYTQVDSSCGWFFKQDPENIYTTSDIVNITYGLYEICFCSVETYKEPTMLYLLVTNLDDPIIINVEYKKINQYFFIQGSSDILGTANINVEQPVLLDRYDFTKIIPVQNAFFALTEIGDVYCWGKGHLLGLDDPDAVVVSPLLHPYLKNIKHISGMTYIETANHCFAIDTFNNLYFWGHNNVGQLGIGFESTDNTLFQIPQKHPYMMNIKDAKVSNNTTVILSTEGIVYGCGNTKNLGLGDLYTTSSNLYMFTEIPIVEQIKKIISHRTFLSETNNLYDTCYLGTWTSTTNPIVRKIEIQNISNIYPKSSDFYIQNNNKDLFLYGNNSDSSYSIIPKYLDQNNIDKIYILGYGCYVIQNDYTIFKSTIGYDKNIRFIEKLTQSFAKNLYIKDIVMNNIGCIFIYEKEPDCSLTINFTNNFENNYIEPAWFLSNTASEIDYNVYKHNQKVYLKEGQSIIDFVRVDGYYDINPMIINLEKGENKVIDITYEKIEEIQKVYSFGTHTESYTDDIYTLGFFEKIEDKLNPIINSYHIGIKEPRELLFYRNIKNAKLPISDIYTFPFPIIDSDNGLYAWNINTTNIKKHLHHKHIIKPNISIKKILYKHILSTDNKVYKTQDYHYFEEYTYLKNILDASTGYNRSLFVTTNGTVYYCGETTNGIFGTGNLNENVPYTEPKFLELYDGYEQEIKERNNILIGVYDNENFEFFIDHPNMLESSIVIKVEENILETSKYEIDMMNQKISFDISSIPTKDSNIFMSFDFYNTTTPNIVENLSLGVSDGVNNIYLFTDDYVDESSIVVNVYYTENINSSDYVLNSDIIYISFNEENIPETDRKLLISYQDTSEETHVVNIGTTDGVNNIFWTNTFENINEETIEFILQQDTIIEETIYTIDLVGKSLTFNEQNIPEANCTLSISYQDTSEETHIVNIGTTDGIQRIFTLGDYENINEETIEILLQKQTITDPSHYTLNLNKIAIIFNEENIPEIDYQILLSYQDISEETHVVNIGTSNNIKREFYFDKYENMNMETIAISKKYEAIIDSSKYAINMEEKSIIFTEQNIPNENYNVRVSYVQNNPNWIHIDNLYIDTGNNVTREYTWSKNTIDFNNFSIYVNDVLLSENMFNINEEDRKITLNAEHITTELNSNINISYKYNKNKEIVIENIPLSIGDTIETEINYSNLNIVNNTFIIKCNNTEIESEKYNIDSVLKRIIFDLDHIPEMNADVTISFDHIVETQNIIENSEVGISDGILREYSVNFEYVNTGSIVLKTQIEQTIEVIPSDQYVLDIQNNTVTFNEENIPLENTKILISFSQTIPNTLSVQDMLIGRGDDVTHVFYFEQKLIDIVTNTVLVKITTNLTYYAWGTESGKIIFNNDQKPQKDDVITLSFVVYQKKKLMIKSVACERFCSYLISNDGNLYSSGSSFVNGHGVNKSTFTQVSNISNVKYMTTYSKYDDVARVHKQIFFATDNINLYSMGNLTIYLGRSGNSYTLQQINDIENVRKIAVTDTHLAVLTENGDVYTWGDECWAIPSSGGIYNISHLGYNEYYSKDKLHTIPKKATVITFPVDDIAVGRYSTFIIAKPEPIE